MSRLTIHALFSYNSPPQVQFFLYLLHCEILHGGPGVQAVVNMCRLQQLAPAQQLARRGARAADIAAAAADAPGAELCHGPPGHARLPNSIRQPAVPRPHRLP